MSHVELSNLPPPPATWGPIQYLASGLLFCINISTGRVALQVYMQVEGAVILWRPDCFLGKQEKEWCLETPWGKAKE